jgi:RNA 2',3'-cyclic 3'-phosphodiesterase
MIRAFIAITPPETLQQAFANAQGALQRLSLPFRWVKPAQVHLTLRFLGDVAPEAIDPIAQAMQRAVATLTPFALAIQGMGCFPNLARPRVLWMGIHASHDMLLQLHQRLDAELAALGFTPEARPFRPHLTLARGQQRVDSRHLATVLHAYHGQHFGDMLVERVQLMQSQLHRDGAVYTMLRSVTLQH